MLAHNQSPLFQFQFFVVYLSNIIKLCNKGFYFIATRPSDTQMMGRITDIFKVAKRKARLPLSRLLQMVRSLDDVTQQFVGSFA